MFKPFVPEFLQWDYSQMTFWQVDYRPEMMRQRRKHLYCLTDNVILFDKRIVDQCDGVISSLDDLDDETVKNSCFYVYFSREERVIKPLRRVVKCGGLFAPPPYLPKSPFHDISSNFVETYNEAGTRLGREPFGHMEIHAQLCQAVELTEKLEGDFVECGVFTGSSGLMAQLHMRNRGIKRRCWLLDTYSGFNYEAARESSDFIWGDTHAFISNGKVMDTTDATGYIKSLMANTGQEVHVVENNICTDELPAEIKSIAIANIDVDVYEAVLTALRKVGERMVLRGIMVVEDPASGPGCYGAYLALMDFLDTDLGKKFISMRTTMQYFVVRVE